jgi:integrase
VSRAFAVSEFESANRLSAEEGKRLLRAAQVNTLRGKRDFAMLALLIGCGLRRGELLGLDCESIQLREEHWVIAGHVSIQTTERISGVNRSFGLP